MASSVVVTGLSRDQVRRVFDGMLDNMAQAASAAVSDAGVIVKKRGRAAIAAGGFSKRWQNALRVEAYPKGRASLRAAAFMYHKIPYAGIFQTGGTISGKPIMWLPIPGGPAAKNFGGRKMTPQKWAKKSKSLGDLIYVKGKKHPLLIRVPPKKKKRGRFAKMFPGGKGQRQPAIKGVDYVPVFFGVTTVQMRKRFDVMEAPAAGRAALPGLFAKHLRRTSANGK
ncbi:DUF6441 family protein [Methylocystis parvus]|uniref:DUF6441 family protein n=1 Tax=Methylocystis parvus TaxID=134 RepID=UPI003C77522C